MVRMLAAAKINLSLEIVGRRPDGFHDLVSILQEVTLFDSLELESADSPSFASDAAALDVDDNLVVSAIRLMSERFTPGVSCRARLGKRIPVSAGLGGGSSDAAAALVGLSRLWQTPGTCQDYMQLALELGSDVPFFLFGGTALIRGRGELVSALPDGPERWYLLVNPGLAVSTARIFATLSPHDWSDGTATLALAREMEAGGDPGFGTNGLQSTLFRLFPDAHRCFKEVERLAPGRTIVSGSGPTVVARFDSAADAARAAESLSARGYWTAAVQNRDREGGLPCP